jgi:hypothetical protein
VAHPASCPMGIQGPFPGVKRLGSKVDQSPLSSAEVKESGAVELYLHSPNMSSWRDAKLKKHRDNFTFTFYSSGQ